MYKKCEEILNKLESEGKIKISDYQFPPKQELKLKLKDMLEENVDEKYYLSDAQIKRIETTTYNVGKTRIQKKEWYGTLCARDWKDPKCVEVNRKYGIFDTEKSTHQAGSVYDENGLAPTLDTMQGGWRQPCIEISCDKPRKDIKEVDRYCEYCGNKLERKRFNGRLEDFTVFSNRKYCNRECMKKDYLKIGDNHNQSISTAHATARKINELILHKEVCELCGCDENLDIHHIDGNWQNNNLDNLMCLCRSCHNKEHKPKDKCVICGEPQKGYGYCNKHYIRFKKYGNPLHTENKTKEKEVVSQ